MGLCPSAPTVQDPADAAVAGIQEDQLLSPFNYLINAAAQMGKKVTIDGKDYDFTGVGQADTAAKVSDQMAQTLLQITKEKSPELIAQRLKELQAADPQGYAARQQLFDKIMADANANQDRPLSQATNQLIQDELAKGVGFSDDKQKREYQDSIRGGQVKSGIYLGNTKAREEAGGMINAGEALRSQRQQNALDLVQSGSTPEDIAYRKLQQTLANLASFSNGTTPEAQFGQVSAAGSGPVSFNGNGVNTDLYNPNAAGQGINNSLQSFQTSQVQKQNTPNPWTNAFSSAFNAVGSLKQINPQWM